MKAQTAVWVALALAIQVGFLNCAPTKFESAPTPVQSGSSQGAIDPASGSQVPVTGNPAEQQFETLATFNQTQTSPLDIVWVIDNSGSMDAEAAHVRKNFLGFIDSVKAFTDLKVALISTSVTANNGVTIPVAGANYLQIDQKVESHDPLKLAGTAFCGTTPAAGSGCAEMRLGMDFTRLNKVAGKLRGFLRNGSKKAFVFVTDDESQVSAARFRDAFKETFPSEEPIVYGFISYSAALSPCRAAEGLVYQALATDTGGATFNVCDADWTKTFEQLASNVIRIAALPIVVPDDVRKGTIVSVELDGQLLIAGQYWFTNQGLVFDPQLTKNLTTVSVKIRYKK